MAIEDDESGIREFHLDAIADADPYPYWYEDADEPDSNPTLVRTETCDLCIVGGGYTGLWTALIAKERDPSRDVVLIDAHEIGSAASGRNGGFMESSLTHGVANGQERFPDELALLEELGLKNLNDIEAAIKRYNIDCDYERTGVIDVATQFHSASYLPELRDDFTHLRSLGQKVELLDAEGMRRQVNSPTYTGGLGFGFKWNMGWMNDSLRYISQDPIHRRFHQSEITFSMLYAFHEHFVLVLSHDEVVHGKGSLIDKMPGDYWQKFANCRMFLAWMWAHPGKKLIFQGIEFGQFIEWNHDQSLDWHLTQMPAHDGLRRLVQHLNWLYQNEPSLSELDDSYDGFEWIDFNDADNTVWSFMRKSRTGATLIFVVNATPVVREAYRVGIS